MRILIALPVAIGLVSAPAAAQEPQATEDKIVCKRNETYTTGSRLSRPKKVCMKASEWKHTEDEKDRTLRKVQDGKVGPNQPTTLGSGGPG